MEYQLVLNETAAGTGYFACLPAAEIDLEEALAYQRAHPHDDFMHRHLINRIAGLSREAVRRRIAETGRDDTVVRALLLEACLLVEGLHPLLVCFEESEADDLSARSPSAAVRCLRQPDRALHQEWVRILGANICSLAPLPPPVSVGLEAPAEVPALAPPAVHIRSLSVPRREPGDAAGSRPWEDTSREALRRLEALGRTAGPEMRHEASLSPWALLRKWHLDTRVVNGRHDYRLSGLQTAYGKGLSLERARAACLMEIVERICSFAGVDRGCLTGHSRAYPLVRARLSELQKEGSAALDPNRLRLEAPYPDAPLHWMEGEAAGASGGESILVPVQAVYLFSNLDEISLFTALGSTGLASGNAVAQARRNALLEVLERDAEATTPYDPRRCFTLEARDEDLAGLLAYYRGRGVDLFFQDLTPPMGVPCYKCLVIAPDGSQVKGTGAHLDAKRALLSALTETPYPFPNGPPSRPAPAGLGRRVLEDLPDYTSGSWTGDLALLETLLAANGHRPVYVDLTRADLSFPVVRALIPGLELAADFDRFSRVGPRLWANYLAYIDGGDSA